MEQDRGAGPKNQTRLRGNCLVSDKTFCHSSPEAIQAFRKHGDLGTTGKGGMQRHEETAAPLCLSVCVSVLFSFTCRLAFPSVQPVW